MVSCNFYYFNWVRIDMSHILSHSFMMLPPPRCIYSFQEKGGGHKSLRIIHQDNSDSFLLQFFRDDHSEYEDHMDILKCIPSVRLSDVSKIDLSAKQTTASPSEFSPKGAVG